MLIEGLYEIVDFQLKDQEIDATIKLNKDHAIFKGHFPGNPVMPGVCMLQIIKELIEKASGKKLFLSVSTNIKFMAIINPEVNPMLHFNISMTEAEDSIKIKNISSFDDTAALKLSATFKVLE